MIRRRLACIFLAVWAALLPAAATAQPVQSKDEALAQDATLYAARYAVPANEALRRLRAQQATAPATDRIRAEFADRLAGISIQHLPDFRIIVLLTGDSPVA